MAARAARAAGAAPAAAAPPTPAPYGTHDGRGFLNVLPPGQNGLANLTQLGEWEAAKTRPPHNNDQLAMYGDLVFAVPGLKASQISKYYKDATFGVKPSNIDLSYSPRGDVTIVRDKRFAVPHVYGATRAGPMFGLGYAAAEHRLFFLHILRHLGPAQLSSFVGGPQGNRRFDHAHWPAA